MLSNGVKSKSRGNPSSRLRANSRCWFKCLQSCAKQQLHFVLRLVIIAGYSQVFTVFERVELSMYFS
uniref:Uncharacterized protein n=1 Tax=Ciona intestinalis TaxID=7719 RepID=H2XVU6_CIOIN